MDSSGRGLKARACSPRIGGVKRLITRRLLLLSAWHPPEFPDGCSSSSVESLCDAPHASVMNLSTSEVSSPEKRLLVCCARRELRPAMVDEIRSLVRGPIDWELLLREAAEHSVAPLLSRHLSVFAADLIDPAQLEQLSQLARAHAMRSLVFTAELVSIMGRFDAAGIEAIPYKGPVLAVQAFGDVALREFEDLDIVLRQRDVPIANEVMASLGYRAKFPALAAVDGASVVPAEYMYLDEPRRMMVELHTERTLRHFPVAPNLDDLTSRLVAISVAGHDLFTFGPEDTFILLCIHGSKHFWERLSWIADIAAFIDAHPDLDWAQILRRAELWRANRIVTISLALALRFFGSPLPADVSVRVRSDSSANAIARRIEQSFSSRQRREPGAFARFRLRRQMLEGFAEGWSYSVRLATLPSDDDWFAMRLPSFLAPLYPVLRPLRLLGKYGVTGAVSPHESFASKKASN